MIAVMVSHPVKQYAQWKDIFDDFYGQRQAAGELSYQVFQNTESQLDIEILFTWDSEKHAKEFFHSDALRQAMSEAGVISEPHIRYLQRCAKGKLQIH